MASEREISCERALEILGLEKGASNDDIKRAYKDLARLYHPDKCTDENATEKFQEVSAAYRILMSSSGFDDRNENGDVDFDTDEDDYTMFFELLQECVFRMRFANQARLQFEDTSGYSRRYIAKSINVQMDDAEFYNTLRKKQHNAPDDDLDPEKVVKKYKTVEDWVRAKNSKKKAKTPRPLSKKQLNHQQYIREKECKQINAEILKNQEKMKAKLEKLSIKKEDTEWKNQSFDISTLNTLLYPSKKTTKPKFSICGSKKLLNKGNSQNKIPATIVVRKPLEKRHKKETKVESKSDVIRHKTVVVEHHQSSQVEKRKPVVRVQEEVEKLAILQSPPVNSPPLNYAAAAKKLNSPTKESSWDYSSGACADSEHLVPSTLDEEERMLQQAIASSMETQKEVQQRIIDSCKQEKIRRHLSTTTELDPEPLDDLEPILSPTLSPIHEPNPDKKWEKFGVRPKMKHYMNNIQLITPPRFNQPIHDYKTTEPIDGSDAEVDPNAARRAARQKKIVENNELGPIRTLLQAPLKRNAEPPERIDLGPILMRDLDKIVEREPQNKPEILDSLSLYPNKDRENPIPVVNRPAPDLEPTTPDLSPQVSPHGTPDKSLPPSFLPEMKTPPGLVLPIGTGMCKPETNICDFMAVPPIQIPYLYPTQMNAVPWPYMGGMMYPVMPPILPSAFGCPMLPMQSLMRMPCDAQNPGSGDNMARLEGGEDATEDEVIEKNIEEMEKKLNLSDETEENIEKPRDCDEKTRDEEKSVRISHVPGKRRGCLRLQSQITHENVREKGSVNSYHEEP